MKTVSFEIIVIFMPTFCNRPCQKSNSCETNNTKRSRKFHKEKYQKLHFLLQNISLRIIFLEFHPVPQARKSNFSNVTLGKFKCLTTVIDDSNKNKS